jgi:hypothetical protein
VGARDAVLERSHRARGARGQKRVLVARALGNSLRALIKHLDWPSRTPTMSALNVPTGLPLVYGWTDALRPLRQLLPRRPGGGRQAPGAVAAQGKAKT